MKEKTYLYVGNWSFTGSSAKGITIYEYDMQSGELKLIETVDSQIAAGQLYLDEKNRLLYSNDERGDLPGKIGGGGMVLSYRIENDGKLTELNRRPSLSPEPSYLCRDRSGKYLVVCHCTDPFHVTKITKNEEGELVPKVMFDDTALSLFRIEEDGSIGKAVDVAITESCGPNATEDQVKVDPVSGHIQMVRVLSRLHSVVLSPDGAFILVCDKGMDRVYTFRVDDEKGKLEKLYMWEAPERACFPRYSTFHPTRQLAYVNNENSASINTFAYDENGVLERKDLVFLLETDPGLIDGKPAGCQDILISPDGKTIYCSISGLNQIVVCRINEDGYPRPIQQLSCRGKFPRGLQLAPDNRFLICGNMISGDITTFAVNEDGSLTDTDKTFKAVSPSALRFITI
ncbi:MAG: beta-propeller fold lactonase family protein [Eubacteriales bacterium]|nr:beta-propeller fold lactonase family protein [Eubacteriales bacterium]